MNNNIQEDHCSFEVSKLLKEKGFDCQCGLAHIEGEEFAISIDLMNAAYGLNVCTNTQIEENKEDGWEGYIENKEIVMCPTHALAIKWIRENFGIHISCTYYSSPQMSGKQYFYNIYDGRSFKQELHLSPEEATEAALKYTLENLI